MNRCRLLLLAAVAFVVALLRCGLTPKHSSSSKNLSAHREITTMRVVFLFLLLVISMISAPAVTQAQFGGMFGGRLETPFFTAEDRQIITEMAVNMLNADPDGSTRPWSNPTSGGAGNLSVVRSYEHNGLPCRDMALDKRTGERKGRWAWRMCRIKDGSWKIAE